MSGLAKVYSGAIYGVDAYEVEIEVNVGNGDPRFVVVGLPDAAVKESTDRVWLSWRRNSFPNSFEYFSAVETLHAPTNTFAGRARILSATLSP